MMKQLIQVFEHQHLIIGKQGFTQGMFEALQRHYGEGKPYYSLIHKGVKFNQFVGVIQVGKVMIEVLPKVDKSDSDDKNEKGVWQKRLIEMLLATSTMESQITGSANLTLKVNSILEAYFSLFLNEVEQLLHRGLLKKYRKQQSNLTALKGRLNFSKQIRHNSVHQERFFVEHTVYDPNHLYHQILYKTLKLIQQLSSNTALSLKIKQLLMTFPEMSDVKVDHPTFERIIYHRNNQHYQAALSIAKLLQLNYHPDITQGSSSVLSLMFDMNQLWEKFVLASLRRYKSNNMEIRTQTSKLFWISKNHSVSMKPDIVIYYHVKGTNDTQTFVLDTKWKCPNYAKPSVEDLRQLYVYHHYFDAHKVALVYPSAKNGEEHQGQYQKTPKNESEKNCSLLFLNLPQEMNEKRIETKEWQKRIFTQIKDWIE